MARKQSGRTRQIPRVEKTWVIGISEMPAMINPLEGEFALMFVMEDDLLVGAVPLRIDGKSPLNGAFDQICARPAVGVPRRPKSLLVDNRVPGLLLDAESLGLPLAYGKSPEFEEALSLFIEHQQASDRDDTFDYEEYPPADTKRFFTLTAAWVKLAPWEYLSDVDVLLINSKQLKLSNWVACVMGNSGQSYGILFFKNMAAYRQFSYIGRNQSKLARMSLKEPIVALNFEEVSLVPQEWRKAQMANAWPVAATEMFPVPEIYSKKMERGLAPGSVMNMISDIVEALSKFWRKNGKKIISGSSASYSDEFRIGGANIGITLLVSGIP